MKDGAFAQIARNVFDFNRHAISAGGETGNGYFAHDNLILKGGGFHECYGWPIDVYCHYTQQFDVHGTDYCAEIVVPFHTFHIYPYGCGQAGKQFEMTSNAFQYTRGDSIKIRGNPTSGAHVTSNVFAVSSGDAITQNGTHGFGENITKPIEGKEINTFKEDTYGKYGVCDFDGDGKDDLFLPTGVSWWYMSGAKMHWVYLNSSIERLDQVGLGDFDGDHVCDVFSVHGGDFGIYRGGTGNWQPLGTYNIPFSELRFGDFNGDGIMDIFRRAPDGQWSAISPGVYDWMPLESSSLSLSELRFGHFNPINDRVTDVIAVVDGHWSVSYGGRTQWQPLNVTQSSRLQSVIIADIKADGIDDIVRYTFLNHVKGPWEVKWEVSWDGRTDWKPLKTLTIATPDSSPPQFAGSVNGFAGRFNGTPGAELLSVDSSRMGQVYDVARQDFVPHSLYPY